MAMKNILRYLSGIQRSGIVLVRISNYSISGFCDAHWGKIHLIERVRLEFLFMLEAHLSPRFLRNKVLWLDPALRLIIEPLSQSLKRLKEKTLLSEFEVLLPLHILIGGQGATYIANNPICHIKLKHVAMDLRFVRERTEKDTLVVRHIPGTQQKADILTKALKPKPFKELQSKVVEEVPQVWRGMLMTRSNS